MAPVLLMKIHMDKVTSITIACLFIFKVYIFEVSDYIAFYSFIKNF